MVLPRSKEWGTEPNLLGCHIFLNHREQRLSWHTGQKTIVSPKDAKLQKKYNNRAVYNQCILVHQSCQDPGGQGKGTGHRLRPVRRVNVPVDARSLTWREALEVNT